MMITPHRGMNKANNLPLDDMLNSTNSKNQDKSTQYSKNDIQRASTATPTP